MKKQLLFFILLLFCFGSGFGQKFPFETNIIGTEVSIEAVDSGLSEYSFPTDSAVWSVEEYTWASFPEQDKCITKHYGLYKDTLIEGKTYNKLYGNNLSVDYPYSDTEFNIATAHYVAAIREDSSKKVYVRMPLDSIDILYYDFALDSGDTFCFNYFSKGCRTVTNVDSVLINGNYRKQIRFEYLDLTEIWIEGIGSTTGWFEWQYTGSYSWDLLCYSENGVQLYGNNYCHCDTYTGINANNLSEEDFIIYPTISSEKINIKLNDKRGNSKYKVDIYSISGKYINSINLEENKFTIQIHNLVSGIYFLKITDDKNNQLIKKFIKN